MIQQYETAQLMPKSASALLSGLVAMLLGALLLAARRRRVIA